MLHERAVAAAWVAGLFGVGVCGVFGVLRGKGVVQTVYFVG
jgi:hypothetical protein